MFSNGSYQLKLAMERKISLLSLVYFALMLGILMRILISNGLMNEFTSYTTSGGMFLGKLHIGTYLIVFAFVLLLTVKKSEFGTKRFSYHSFLFISVTIFVLVVQTFKFGVSSVAYLVDTFLVAGLAGLLLDKASPGFLFLVYRFILYIVLLNSIIAIIEFVTRSHFIMIDTLNFTHFRAQALFGHPLLNALLTGLFVISLISTQKLTKSVIAFMTVGLIALLAFGGRAALVMFILLIVTSVLGNLGKRIVSGRARASELVGVPIVVFFVVSISIYMVIFSSFGERYREMSGIDNNSSIARLEILSVYTNLTNEEIAWGISPEKKDMLVQQNPYFNTIENFWVDISLSFGLVLFIFFGTSFLLFLYNCSRDNKGSLIVPFLFFVVVASSNNALSVKSPALIFFVVLMLSLRKRTQMDPSKNLFSANRDSLQHA